MQSSQEPLFALEAPNMYKMASKGITEFILFSLVLMLFVAHQASCLRERDNYLQEKICILGVCKDSIRKGGRYISPNLDCKSTCRSTDMSCVCRILTPIDKASVQKRWYNLQRNLADRFESEPDLDGSDYYNLFM